ncbi:hypothetical protein CXG81DRAFT_25217 [Caulochytrium protostelioides]|uniref:G protein gamma domain-containing protein n=1 Tax=Caulochytrium protostelioides TaxID=1555241 RepID=A0A4P9X9Z5_9FUNG|nr:hypothetical protein CXG81DRAFT_25217 [Caulochytrium protostelioides]|eukprot:RKP02132.1 hypothetical protein CXG81DRAFT_25217 [Caulochytrium protostelioides]
MTELKLQKLLALNERLRQEEEFPRVRVSEASKALVSFVTSTEDPLSDPGRIEDNPFTKKTSKGGCTIL